MFASARQALRFALALQPVAEEELPRGIGVGLDAGEAVAVEDGYRGGALNRAARLCGLAGPGYVLASDGVVHLAGRVELPMHGGVRRLKGFDEPVTLVEVQPADASRPRALLRGPAVEARPSGGAGRASGSRCGGRSGPALTGWWKREADGRSDDHRHVGSGGVRRGTRELARQLRPSDGQAQRVDRRPDGVELRHRRAVARRPRPDLAVSGRGRPESATVQSRIPVDRPHRFLPTVEFGSIWYTTEDGDELVRADPVFQRTANPSFRQRTSSRTSGPTPAAWRGSATRSG